MNLGESWAGKRRAPPAPRGPDCDYPRRPAPIQPVGRSELLRLALACEAGWDAKRGMRAAPIFRAASA